MPTMIPAHRLVFEKKMMQKARDEAIAERDALQAQLAEARGLAERWEDYCLYYYTVSRPDNITGYAEPPTCPWRKR